MPTAADTAPVTATLGFVTSERGLPEAFEDAALERLPVSVFRVSRYRDLAGQELRGSSPIPATDLLVLESTGRPPETGALVAAVGAAVVVCSARACAGDLPTASEHTALLVVLVDNTAADREDEFVRWYGGTHIPEVLATGTYVAAARLDVDADGVGTTGARHLSLWATDWDDPAEALSTLFAHNPQMTMWSDLDRRHIGSYTLAGRAQRPRPRDEANAAA